MSKLDDQLASINSNLTAINANLAKIPAGGGISPAQQTALDSAVAASAAALTASNALVGGTGGPLAITSAAAVTFPLNQSFSFLITTTGTPTPKITSSGVGPAGLVFTDNGDGTATLAGTATTAGSATLTIAITNGVQPDTSQSLVVTVQ